MSAGLLELTTIIVLAAILSIIARIFRQPAILAYLFTGVVISVLAANGIATSAAGLHERETFQIFADLGIMFLLFLVGLEVNYTSLRYVGAVALSVGLLQVVFTALVGYGIAILLGFAPLSAVYIGIALTFSSTIVVVKLLSEKKELNSLYGKISIGLLLVQDFIAILVLIALSGIKSGADISLFSILFTTAQGIVIFVLMVLLGKRVFPPLFDLLARSQELLFLMSLAWLFLMAAVMQWMNFSIEIGGFLAGIALANASEHYQIASRVRSLRDFFILIFFVILGSYLQFTTAGGLLIPVLIFSLFVLVGNLVIVMIVMSAMGYTSRTSFLTAVSIAQISEFSLVLANLGRGLGHIGDREFSLITWVGIITITASTYLINYNEAIYRKLRNVLLWFERKSTRVEEGFSDIEPKRVILVGFTRTGQSIAMHLKKDELLIIDQDPEIIHALQSEGYSYLYGDASDDDLFEHVDLSQTELIISTVPTFEDNLALLELITRVNHERGGKGERPIAFVVRAESDRDAVVLYRRGASYVLMPHFTSGHVLGNMVAGTFDRDRLLHMRERELTLLTRGGSATQALRLGASLIHPSKQTPPNNHAPQV